MMEKKTLKCFRVKQTKVNLRQFTLQAHRGTPQAKKFFGAALSWTWHVFLNKSDAAINSQRWFTLYRF